jgi:hypothetical protein
MKFTVAALFGLSLMACASVAQHPDPDTSYIGLTQAQLAKRLGFPIRVFMMQDGPDVLYWSYYQRSTPDIDEKVFGFAGSPLKVSGSPLNVRPSLFLSLERPNDASEIRRYEAKHGR